MIDFVEYVFYFWYGGNQFVCLLQNFLGFINGQFGIGGGYIYQIIFIEWRDKFVVNFVYWLEVDDCYY